MEKKNVGQPVEGHNDIFYSPAFGRVYTVHPSKSELFHLRLLLHVVKGPTDFQNLKTVDGILHDSFRDACNALGLLEDDVQGQQTLGRDVRSVARVLGHK